MPARAESLAITERYRSGMIRLRRQGQREAKRLWARVRPDDLDGTFPLGELELTVSTLQREAARLSSAYLATFIASELGEPERPPAISVWDKTFGGNPLREGLRSAIIKAKTAIKDGTDPREATNTSRAILVSDVGLFIDTAARESLRQGMEMDDRIVGYQRALKGTCGACSGSTSYEAFSENAPVVPLNVHPNCQCVAEPVVQPRSKEPTQAQITAAQHYEVGYGVDDMTALRAAGGDITKLAPEVQARIRNLTNLIESQEQDAPLLYRVVNSGQLSAADRELLMTTNAEFREWGLSAASANPQFPGWWAEQLGPMGIPNPVVFEIRGAKGLSVDGLAQRMGWDIEGIDPSAPAVREWWLRPGTKFRVGKESTVRIGGVKFRKIVLHAIR